MGMHDGNRDLGSAPEKPISPFPKLQATWGNESSARPELSGTEIHPGRLPHPMKEKEGVEMRF
jgi:hypothetical protein